MEKTEAMNKLKKAGYQVQFDSSVVTVLLEKRANITQEIKKLRSYLQEIGYTASFGVKQIKDDSIPEKKDIVLKDKKSVQEFAEVSSEEKEPIEKEEKFRQNSGLNFEETLEIGKQFSLEDFGIS